MKKIITICSLLLIFLILNPMIALADYDEVELEAATVIRVIDGDTVEVAGRRIIRLIGVNAPELGEYTASEATQFVIDHALNRTVWLEPDGDDTDLYGRYRRYVWLSRPNDINSLDEIRAGMLNARLLSEGLAEVQIFGEVRHEQLFRQLERPLRHTMLEDLIPPPTGEVVGVSSVEFFTVRSQGGGTFFLALDHSATPVSVRLLTAVTEWELFMLAQDAEIPMPPDVALSPEIIQRYDIYIPEPVGDNGDMLSPYDGDHAHYHDDGYAETSAFAEFFARFGSIIIIVVAGIVFFFVVLIFKKKKRQREQEDDHNDEMSEFDDDIQIETYED